MTKETARCVKCGKEIDQVYWMGNKVIDLSCDHCQERSEKLAEDNRRKEAAREVQNIRSGNYDIIL